ncbi:uncharacterized protein BROUX77_006110 [Berkeleyomyces rouxiae]|uniref:uncharacterized protein n=1 Tax=Berkeleyomyces rouxiae TaxID=2035830 RepID=UPI003B7B291A
MTGIHPVFHVSLVRRARDDPLPSQVLANPEPPAIAPEEASGDLVAGEYLVDEILQHKVVDKHRKALHQRYINSTLRDYLDDFCSAYLDDVLIYTDGSHKDHMRKVNLVLERLGDAGLRLDLNKCEFAVTETKYLGFIIQAGEGIKVDPAKVAAIREWQPPTNVKGVRSFLGFANFYRQFIPLFSEVAAPLVRLTKKEEPWKWSKTENQAFEKLKNDFMRAPVLAMWDEERPTIVECDCSGWALGGTLSQVDV